MTDDQSVKGPEPTDEEIAQAIQRARERMAATQFKEMERVTRNDAKIGAPAYTVTERPCPNCKRPRIVRIYEEVPASLSKYAHIASEAWADCACEIEAEIAEWVAERRNAAMQRLYDHSNLSARYMAFKFDTFDATRSAAAASAVSTCIEYVAEFEAAREEGGGLYLFGAVGVGKTHLAVATMHALMERYSTPCLFVALPELLARLRRSYSDAGPGETLFDSAMHAEVLVLDDLGAERDTEWVTEQVFLLVDWRYSHSLPTIYTSNIGPAEVAYRLGERTASRIASSSRFIDLGKGDQRLASRRQGS